MYDEYGFFWTPQMEAEAENNMESIPAEERELIMRERDMEESAKRKGKDVPQRRIGG